MVGRGWGHHLVPENPAQQQVACALTGTSLPTHLAENLAASEINLAAPLAADPEMAFNDLVYVMETAVSLGVASEGEVMATFLELFSLREALDENARRKMLGIQQYLRGMISGV
jgi:hypothetical protein